MARGNPISSRRARAEAPAVGAAPPARLEMPREGLFLEYYCLYRIASTLTHQMDAERTVRELKKIIREHFKPRQYSLMLLDEKNQSLSIKSQFGFHPAPAQTAHLSVDHDLFSFALRRKRELYVPNLEKAPANLVIHPHTHRKQGAFLSVPIFVHGNRALGVFNLYRREPESFHPREIDLLRKIAAQVAEVLDKISLYRETRELSITDELTGLFNRRYFNQRYEREFMRATRYRRPLSVIMLDIDHFKKYNDTHGHLLGDKILKMVAEILEGSIRKADLLARFGGEEFVLVLPEIDKERGSKVAEKLRRAIEHSQFPKAETQPFGRITCSLGLASFPEDSEQGADLLAMADGALYEAKSRGRNQAVAAGKYSRLAQKDDTSPADPSLVTLR